MNRSLSPMRFGDLVDKERSLLAGMTNKDWALSEVYNFVKQKTQYVANDESPQQELPYEENFK